MLVTSSLLLDRKIFICTYDVQILWTYDVSLYLQLRENSSERRDFICKQLKYQDLMMEKPKATLKHSQSKQHQQWVTEQAHLIHRKWPLCISQLLSWQRSLRFWKRVGGWWGWMMFVSRPFVTRSILPIKLLAVVWRIHFDRDKEWWIKTFKQGRVKNVRIFFSHSISKPFISTVCLAS